MMTIRELINRDLLAEKMSGSKDKYYVQNGNCLLYTSPSPRDRQKSRMPSSA